MIPPPPKSEEDTESNVQPRIIITTCVASTTVSVAMLLLNKAIILSIPFSGGLVLLQNTVTILLVQSYLCLHRLDLQTLRGSIPCALLFGINTFTSMQALLYLSVTAFTILRNTQSILSYPLDYMLRGESLRPVSVFCLLTILLGTCAFCTKDLRANVEGIAWAAVHVLSSTLYAVLAKLRTERDEFKQDPLRRTLEMAWFNNMLSLPIIGAAAAIQAMYMPQLIARSSCSTPFCWYTVALSCLGGCALSVIGLRTQSLLSPVMFLTFNNLNKIPAMLLSAAIWPHLETTDTAQEVLGIVLSIYGGYLFAVSKTAPVHPFAVFVAVALSVALVPLMVLGERVPLQVRTNLTIQNALRTP
jgi:hypothetical protein